MRIQSLTVLLLRTALIVLVGAAAAARADSYYVNGTCGNNAWSGKTPECVAPDGPKATIQAGINAAVNGDTVWVADGAYTGVGNRDLDFGGKLITVRSENGPENCIIDCQWAGRGFYFHSGETAEAVVDGFTIRMGYAVNASPGLAYGGGIYNDGSSPTVTNCTFSGNQANWQGGGMCNRNGSSPTVTNCAFIENEAWACDGGGMYNRGASNPMVVNCTFIGNTAHPCPGVGSYAGGMKNLYSSPTVINCTFSGNSAGYGGAMQNGGNTIMMNCKFAGNSATYGGAIVHESRSYPKTRTPVEFV
jgi:hypothetical protein